MSNLGEMLKTARESQGLSLADVEAALHIRRHLLEAMEENEFSRFPSPVIARGFVRNYARFLHLDPNEVLSHYPGNGTIAGRGARGAATGIEFMNLEMSTRPAINWDFIIGGTLFVLVLVAAGYLGYTTYLQPQVTPTPTKTPVVAGLGEDAALILPTPTPPPTATPTPLPPTPTPTPLVYDGVTLEVVITQPSWLQILVDDVKAFEGILQPGERRTWSGRERVAIRAGNAGGVEVIVNGTSRGVMGAAGQVVDQVWEKVDSPAELTPQPTLPAEPTPDTTGTPAAEPTLLPLESAPGGG